MQDRDMYLILRSLVGASNTVIEKLERELGDLETLFELSEQEISNFKNLNLNIKKNIVKYRGRAYLENIKNELYKHDVKFVSVKDELYPEKLRDIYNCPKVLFYRGDLNLLENSLNIGIVGSRRPTNYGIKCAKKFSKELSDSGVNIISGLAMGIDSFSHFGCMEGNSKTIAVLGSSVDNPLPKKNIYIADKIIDSGGLLLSEYYIKSKVHASNFCNRNRIVSGISDGIVVVEAAGKSGSLITVEFALDQGKNVFAVPGNINSELSRGCNKIIKEGAKLIDSIEDILEEYANYNHKKINEQKKIFNTQDSGLNQESELIVSLIKRNGNLHIDKICDYTGIDIKKINIILNKLVLNDVIIEMNNKTYSMNV